MMEGAPAVAFVDRSPPTAGGRLAYGVGDIHGRYDLLKAILVQVTEDSLGRARGRRPMLVFCGDYIDRGPQSAEVIEAMVWLKGMGRMEVHALKGNHEQGLLQFIEEPLNAAPWLRYGGRQTLESYGIQPPSPDDADGDYIRIRDELLRRMPASHLRFLETLELMLVVGDFAFVHAGIRPGAPLAQQDERDLLWIREEFLEAPGPFEKIVVHGHSWFEPRPQVLEHRVGIDTGAYMTGVLTAVRLDDDGPSFMQTAAAPD
ncbi:MAG: metallophosphoesterase family protein [Caulobacteraceae bacterium]